MNKVSCITVTKNRLEYLKKSINHFIKQTHENKEMIIVYYNTDKETEEWLKSSTHLKDNNIYFYKFIDDEGIYLGAVRNYAISKSTGDWICIWDDDDWYSEERIEKQLNLCLENDLDVCALKNIMIFSNKKQLVKKSFSRLEGWEGTLFVKKSIMRKYKNIPKGEDTPVLVYLFWHHRFMVLDDPNLYIYIFHDSNTSGNRHKDNLLEKSIDITFKESLDIKEKLGWL